MYSFIHTLTGQQSFKHFEKAVPPSHPKTPGVNTIPQKYLTDCVVLLKAGIPVGRFAFYENPYLKIEGIPAAAIGQYACEETQESAKHLLKKANELAKAKNYAWLIGPMDGSTWNNYRLNTEANAHPFLMDLDYPLFYNGHFLDNGFNAIAHFYSQVTKDLAQNQSDLLERKKTYESKGAFFRPIDLNKYEQDLAKIAAFSNEAFKENYLFSPIDSDDFIQKYLPLKALIDPDFVQLIENKEGELWAICFAVKDLLDHKGETLILKTLARKKNVPLKDLAFFLGIWTGAKAAQKGYTKVIHALMRSNNASRAASTRTNGQVLNSYALYGKKLS